MEIGSRRIGKNEPCFVVAEAGLAHGGNREAAFELIDVAVRGGADAVKFQVYLTKELVAPGRDRELYDRFRSKELAFSVFGELKEYAAGKGLVWFATPHTISGFRYLKDLGVPVYKIGSGERDGELWDSVMDTKKPTIISTGMRTYSEIFKLVRIWGGENMAFLHCVTMYPVPPHLADMAFLRKLKYVCDITGSVMGYSDHCAGAESVYIAVSLGAKIIEKHIMLDGSKGQDTLCSLTGPEFRTMTKKIRVIEAMLGDGFRHYTGGERDNERWALKSADGRRPM